MRDLLRASLILGAMSVLPLAGCSDDAPGNAFESQTTTAGDSDTTTPEDMPNETGTADGTDDDVGTDTETDDTTETTETTTDTTTDDGGGMCGNGVVDDGEQCDGDDLGGLDCTSLGYSGGELACDPVTCTYDASGCVSDPDGGGGTSG